MAFALGEFVRDFAAAMKAVDSRRPQARSHDGKRLYKPGLGPHSESATIRLVAEALLQQPNSIYDGRLLLEVPYQDGSRNKCDLVLGTLDEPEWAIEMKLLRVLGDNGKPNDNILTHILSPYPKQRSALTDCTKLLESGLGGLKAVLIFGYDYDEYPMLPVIEAFEILARKRVALSARQESRIVGLVHPVHERGAAFAWEIKTI